MPTTRRRVCPSLATAGGSSSQERLIRHLAYAFAIAVVALVLTATAASDTKQTPVIRETSQPLMQAKETRATRAALKRERSTIAGLRLSVWGCQDKIGATRSRASHGIWQLPRSVAYRRWVADRWQGLERGCAKVLSYRTFPLTNDWLTAVRIAQRAYPGTDEWMRSISDREGGWGEWVWYGGRTWNGYHVGDDFLGADTVGGWMQFRYSTFAPYWRQAQEDLARRGFIVPAFPNRGGPAMYQAWLDPLAQALTAGYMRYTGKDGCHWCL